MNTRIKLEAMAKGWRPFLIFIASILVFFITVALPYYWLRWVGLLPVVLSATLLGESMPGGSLDTEQHLPARQTEKPPARTEENK